MDESEEGKEELDECEGMSSRFGVWCMVYHRVGTVSFENTIKYSNVYCCIMHEIVHDEWMVCGCMRTRARWM